MRILSLAALLFIGAASLGALSEPVSAKNADQARQSLVRGQASKNQNFTAKRAKQRQEWQNGFSEERREFFWGWQRKRVRPGSFAYRQPGDLKPGRRLNLGIDPEARRPKSPDDGFEVYQPPALVALSDPSLVAAPADNLASAISNALRQSDSGLRVTPRQKDAIIDFYRLNAFAPLWVNPQGWNDKARRTLALLARAEEEGLDPTDYLPPPLASFTDEADGADMASLARLDIGLSAMALRYGEHLYSGRIVPKRLSGYYDIVPPALNLTRALFELSSQERPDLYLSSLAPRHPAYAAMRASLAELRGDNDGVDLQGVRPLPVATRTDDAEPPHESDERESDEDVLAKLVLNMERIRWLPRELGQRHIFVNQAAFELRLIDGDDLTWRTRVIVGKPETQTAVFSDRMETVVINPYWGVPQSIIRYEFMPKMARDRRYLERNGYEVLTEAGRRISSRSVNWWGYKGKIPFAVRQRPGDDNALGRIKFLFPNSHDIYMHDTPTKELFDEEVRAFSHGCVRVQNPREFAEHVTGWERRRIDDLIATGENQEFDLDRHIPVHLQYFTAWPGDSGAIEFHSDIYGRDARLARALKKIGVSSVGGAKQAQSEKLPPT
jgi:murein L,D-transpeptidase YcbB/YkuD